MIKDFLLYKIIGLSVQQTVTILIMRLEFFRGTWIWRTLIPGTPFLAGLVSAGPSFASLHGAPERSWLLLPSLGMLPIPRLLHFSRLPATWGVLVFACKRGASPLREGESYVETPPKSIPIPTGNHFGAGCFSDPWVRQFYLWKYLLQSHLWWFVHRLCWAVEGLRSSTWML